MFAGGDGHNFLRAQTAIRRVVIRRHRFFEPRRIELGDFAHELHDRFERITFVAHAPPRMRVNHQPDLRPDGLAHLPDGFQIQLRPECGAHFVGGDSGFWR